MELWSYGVMELWSYEAMELWGYGANGHWGCLSACQLAWQSVSHVCFTRRQLLVFWPVGEESVSASLLVAIMFMADQAVLVSLWQLPVRRQHLVF